MWVLALASLASFMVILDMLVVATALTAIHRHLGASLADLEWTVNAGFVVWELALAGVAAGAILPARGRRPVPEPVSAKVSEPA